MKKLELKEQYNSYNGEIEFLFKDVRGVIVRRIKQPNIVKIFAKEILSHGIVHEKVWDPNSSSWVAHNIDLAEFGLKYITFGASFDESGNPLEDSDPRYYIENSLQGGVVPRSLGVGAEFDGGMINAIPISEPNRPLKRIERVFFEPSYQPSGTPFLQDDVRGINNTIVLETTLKKDEYNGFGIGPSDYFTLTEVALVSAREVGNLGACECNPRDVFLTGDNGVSFDALASGTATVSLDPSVIDVNAIKEGDQIKIVVRDGDSNTDDILNQLNPYYLVVNKALGGRDITLDRAVVDEDNTPISGQIGVLRDGFKIFSHRILKTPVKKSSDFEIVVRWRIICN